MLLYAFSQFILLGSFAKLEEQDTHKNIERARDALTDDIVRLDSVVGDWAPWDDTYNFIQNGNKNYIASNLDAPTLANLQVNYMLFYNTSGHLVYGLGADINNKTTIPLPGMFQHDLSPNDTLLRHSDTGSRISGIIILPEGPMLIASQPITTSEHKGPIKGTLIMGSSIDSDRIKHLARITHLSLSLSLINDPNTPDFRSAIQLLSNEKPILIQPISKDIIAGYTLLNDLDGKPAIVIRAEMPREIHKQGENTVNYLVFLILGSGMVFGLVTLSLLEKSVLSRLSFLNANVTAIGKSGDLSTRISMTGNDELSNLASDINNMLGLLKRAQDDRKKAEEISLENERLMYANKAKSEFLSNMSHELRTPLNSVIGFSELLKTSGELNAKQEKYIENIYSSGKNLLDLISDILILVQMEAGKLEISPEQFRVTKAISEVITLIKDKAETRKIALIEEYDPELEFVEADLTRFKQIMFNLLNNAVKFSKPEGGAITIATKKAEDMAQFSISDTGIGIKEEDMPKLFKKFQQIDAGISREYGGTGLGLAISKQLVELQGGKIYAGSKYGEGSTFTFLLPIKTIKADEVKNEIFQETCDQLS